MAMRTIALIGVVALSQIAIAGSDASTHLRFNGFFAGMSKVAARQAGMGSCRYGDGIGETSDAFYCDIPEQQRKLGPIAATKALLEFPLTSRNRVAEIRLTFAASEEQTKAALITAYGPPTRQENEPSYLIWERGPETLKLALMYGSWGQQRAYVAFEYSASVGRARTQAAHDEAKKKKVLREF
jgi:hypothetical protein